MDCIGEAVCTLSFSDANTGRTSRAHQGRLAWRRGQRGRPHRRRRPFPSRGRLEQVRGPVPHPAAQAGLRRVRLGDRRRHPRALHQDLDPRSHTVTNDEIRNFITHAIDENRVMLFMKGTPDQPSCGFSARAAGALNALGVQYAALDILPDPRIRQELSELSGWPTIPQLFVKGELVGGADIVMEMFENGELAGMLGVEQAEDAAELAEP